MAGFGEACINGGWRAKGGALAFRENTPRFYWDGSVDRCIPGRRPGLRANDAIDR